MAEHETQTRENRFRGDLPERTFEFAVTILGIVGKLPHEPRGWLIAKQLLASGTSIGANVHEAAHTCSEADFIHKCSIARKEAFETHFWLRLCQRSGLLAEAELLSAIDEVDQLRRILATIIKKTQGMIDPAQHDTM